MVDEREEMRHIYASNNERDWSARHREGILAVGEVDIGRSRHRKGKQDIGEEWDSILTNLLLQMDLHQLKGGRIHFFYGFHLCRSRQGERNAGRIGNLYIRYENKRAGRERQFHANPWVYEMTDSSITYTRWELEMARLAPPQFHSSGGDTA